MTRTRAREGSTARSPAGWLTKCFTKNMNCTDWTKNYNYARLGSEATLFASLVAAYNLGEPWVGYCYEPTWVSGKLDIVLLEDEPYSKELFEKGGCAFRLNLKIVSSKYFAKKAPDLLEFFKKYKTGSKLISESTRIS